MKKMNGVLAIAAACLVVLGTTGCQSGWKFSNPFSRTPRASDAEAPDELDDDFAEMDDITPPPENYTSGEPTSKKDRTSIAQKGRYGDESVDREVAASESPASSVDADAERQSYATQSYAQDYRSPASVALNEGAGSATQNMTRQSAPDSLSDTVAAITPDASAAAATLPYTPRAAESAPLYSTPDPYSAPASEAQYASNVQPQTVAPNVGAYPVMQTSVSTPAMPQSSPTNVAFNYDPATPAAAPAPTTPAPVADDADPYANVIYTPQNTSGGFAPGSVLY